MAASYATPTDLYRFAIRAAALVSFSTPEIQAALDARSAYAEGRFRSRYRLPLLAWDEAVTMNVCKMAALDLMTVRGFNPANPADAALVLASKQAEAWFLSVARQEAHPDVTESPPSGYDSPDVSTSPKQGW